MAQAVAAPSSGIKLGPLLPLDTKSIVGSVLLAVCFSINMQITERLDNLTGVAIAPVTGVPLANWLGYMFLNLWYPVAVIFFGLTGALIISNFNPIIAIMTATHPLAWSFFFFNMAWAIPNTFVFRYWIQTGKELTMRRFILTCGIGQFFAAVMFVILMLVVAPGAQPWVYFAIPFWNWIMFIPGGYLGYHFFNAVRNSGVLE